MSSFLFQQWFNIIFLFFIIFYITGTDSVTCTNNGPCTYSGSGEDYVCNNNGYCNCGNSRDCKCNNNGYCSCGNALTCSCTNNGDCCHKSSTQILVARNNGRDKITNDGQCLLPAGTIVAITFGVLAFVIIIITCWVCYCRHKNRQRYLASGLNVSTTSSNTTYPTNNNRPPTTINSTSPTPTPVAAPVYTGTSGVPMAIPYAQSIQQQQQQQPIPMVAYPYGMQQQPYGQTYGQPYQTTPTTVPIGVPYQPQFQQQQAYNPSYQPAYIPQQQQQQQPGGAYYNPYDTGSTSPPEYEGAPENTSPEGMPPPS